EEVEILSRDASRRGIRPMIAHRGTSLSGCFSLTHTEQRIAAAGTNEENTWIGIDLVTPAVIKPNQFHWALTEAEKEWIARRGDEAHTLAITFWSLKEATYKAANRDGEGFNPQEIEIRHDEESHWAATYLGCDLANTGEWSVEQVGGDILTRVLLRS
ncbi:MAG: hypothetical protein CMJ46_01730, partial [Planctomyces sp.]|nr:hypothetical protein [Planctomyces sp.]